MKIIYIIDRLIEAGTQRHLYQLAIELKKKKHDIQIVCLEEKGPLAQSLEDKNITVTEFNTGAVYKPDSIKKLLLLAQLLKSQKPDLVQTFLLKANLMGIVAARLARVPIILSSRRSLGYDFKKSHYVMLRLLDRLTTATLVNSLAIKEITKSKENITTDKLTIIYNGVDVNQFDVPKNSSLKQELAIPETAPVIGMVANIRPVKGYEYLFSAMEKVAEQNPAAHCLVVGNVHDNSGYFQRLKTQAEGKGIWSRFRVLQGYKDIPQALSIIDVAVLSSISEGFSNTLLEYMAAGKPIIATRVGGNPEAIKHGRTGFLVPPGDATALADGINQILSNDSFAQSLADNARIRVNREFSLDGMASAHEQYYLNLLTKFQGTKNE